jgi:hypothetical protein
MAGTAVVVASAQGGVGEVKPVSLGSSHGLHYWKGTYGPYEKTDAEVLLACGDSEFPLGAGADATGKAKHTRVSAASPTTLGLIHDAVFSDSQRTGGGTDKRSVTFGVCRSSVPSAYSFNSVEAPPGASTTAKVECPIGKSVGGGFDLDSGNVVRSAPADGADANSRADDAWIVTGRPDLAKQGVGTQIACDDPPSGPTARPSTAGRVRANRARTLRASCPRDTSVASGGFRIAGPAAKNRVHGTRPVDSKADGNKVPDDAWQATLVNGTGKRRRAVVYAVCLG